MTGLKAILSKYHFAWLTNIINQYPIEKGPQDGIKLYEDNNYSTSSRINLLGINSTTGLSEKTVYPLFNGGIHRFTISSDSLATFQYINGHKTATIAENQLGPSTNAQINPMQIHDAFDWKKNISFSQWATMKSQTEGGMTSDNPEYFDTILP